MKRYVLQKRVLPWLLVISLCLGMFPVATHANEATPELLTSAVATEAMEVLYKQDFNDAAFPEDVSVLEDTTATVEGEALTYTAGAGQLLYILGGEMWGYYTVEAKITTQTVAPASIELGFYVKDATTYSKATMESVEANTTYYVKVEANGTSAQAYQKQGDDWVQMGDVITVAKGAQSGSVGFAVTPAGEETTATISIDDVKVTRNMGVEEAKHTLFAVDFEKYTSSATTMAQSDTHKNYYIKTSGSGITVKGQNGKLSIAGSGMMYFDVPDAAHWKNYVVEADIEYAEDSQGLAGLLYRVQNETSYQEAYVSADGATAGLKGYWNDTAEANTGNILHEKTNAGIAEGKRRVQVVVQETQADLYVASYTEDVLGEFEWIMSIDDIADHHPDGSVGFMATDDVAYSVDNLEVYEYTTTYVENFDTDEAVILNEGTNAALGIETSWNDTYQTDTTMTVTGGQFTISRATGNSTGIDLAWFAAGENWTNYTYEADITPSNLLTGENWEGLIYRLADSSLWQRAGITYSGDTIWTKGGAYSSGKFSPNSRTVDLINSINTEGWTSSSSGYRLFESNIKMRMKVVADNNCTWIYYASYDAAGNMGPYNLHVVLPICTSFSGSVGMGATGKYGLTYDNVVVSAIEGDVSKTNLADIYVPETGIVNPGTVVTKVNKSNINSLEKTSVAIMYINENLDVLDENQVETIGSVSQFMKNYGDTIIPAFYMDDTAEATAICAYLKEHGITDAFYVTDSTKTDVMKAARSQEEDGNADFDAIGWRFARGIIEYQTMPTDRAQSRRDILNALASIAIFPTEDLTVDIVAEYNVRTISVWSYVEDKVDVYEGIANGYNGMIATDSSIITDVYQTITRPTVSGKPIVVGHGGKQSDEFNENTVTAFKSAIEEDNAMGIEVDPRITSDNEIILYHESTIGGTDISSMTLEAAQTYMTEAGEELSTLDDAFAFLYEHPGKVMYFQATSYEVVYSEKLPELFEKYPGTGDQVVIFCRYPTRRADPIKADEPDKNRGWLNEYWGDGLPIIGSTIGDTASRFENIAATKNGASTEEVLNAMINRLAPYNHQQIPYDYDIIDSPTDERDSLSYALAARGYLLIQSAIAGASGDLVREQAGLDRFYISEMGTIALLVDHTQLTKEYGYQVQVNNQVLKIGDSLKLAQTVLRLGGEVETSDTIEYGVTWLAGDAVTPSGNSYTMDKEGEATFAYFADIEQARSSGTPLTYRVYSEPVTVIWNETGYVCEHDWSTDYSHTANNHYQVCTLCDDTQNIEPHTEANGLVGEKAATATEAGYTGDVVCEVCGYVMDKGSEIPVDPFAEYTTITPADFGFADGTYTAATSSTKTPLSTFDKVNFAMDFNGTLLSNQGFTYGRTVSYAKTGLKIAFNSSYPDYLMIANNGPSYFTLYDEAGTAKTNIWIHPTEAFPNGNYTTFKNVDVRMNITTDAWDYDGDGNSTDWRVGFWFNGTLYKYYYLVLNEGYALKHELTIAQLGEPGVTIKSPTTFVSQSSPLERYTIVTPSTFGIADQDNAEGITDETPTAGHVKPSEYDNHAFVANIKYTTNWSKMSFLQHNYIESGINIVYSSTGKLNVYNYLNNYSNERGYMYAGGAFEVTDDGSTTYVPDGYEAIGYTNYFPIDPSKTNVAGGAFKDQQITLWLTVDIVDFDLDTYEDDMQLGVWINGQLYDGRYLYITNCDAQADADGCWINERVIVENVTHISSPFIGLEDVGIVAGEYMSLEGEFYPTEATTNILMNGKEFETDIRFEGAGATFYYGSEEDAVKFTSTADGVKVTHTYGDTETDLVTLNMDNVGVDVTKRAFHLKLKTTAVDLDSDGVKDDVNLGISVNNRYREFTIDGAAELLKAQAGVQCESGARVVLGTLDKQNPTKIFHCLNDGAYTKALSNDTQRLSLNGVAQLQGIILPTLGEFRVANTIDGLIHRDEVVTYWNNDVTADDKVGVTDLVRMLKVADDTTYTETTVEDLSEVGRRAIGCKDVALWTAADETAALTNIRNGLLGNN